MIVEGGRIVRLGVKSLMLHKLRSALTTLGILFGVSSVIAMLAIGEGASYKAQQDIKKLGSTNIMIRSVKPPTTQNSSANVWSALAYGLNYLDAERIRATLPNLEDVVPVRETYKEIRAGEMWFPTVVVGTLPSFAEVVNMRVREGRWLTYKDESDRANIAVLGAGAAQRLLPLVPPLGQTIRAGSDRFVVVGVLDYLGRVSGSVGPSLDDAVFVPFATSRHYFGDTMTKMTGGSMEREKVELHEIKVKAKDPEAVLDAAVVIRDMLEDTHGAREDYTVNVPLELLKQAEETKRMFNIVLGSIAGISLLVGGIGIMNVMLATVTERTREIGIRRALGARKNHIVAQFLVETVVLSASGGLLGVGLGLVIPIVVTHYTKMDTVIRPEHAIMAFTISAFVGVVFGLYPAWRAANMDPVEALRHE